MAGLRSPEDMLGAAVLRVRAAGDGGEIAGAGFLVAPELAVTCAHVVSDALRTPHQEPLPDGARVRVDLPLGGGGSADAEVAHWLPYADDGSGDIAVLRLRQAIPGARPLRMAEAGSVWEHAARVPGFPATSPGGIWHAGRLRAGTAEGWVQFSQGDAHGTPIERGFSGAPVWDEQLGAVVGMVARSQLSGPRQSFLIPTGALADAFPALAPVLRPASPFRGLAAFQEADAEVFFGREEEAREVAGLVGAQPYVTVVGPSGSGKSSLALAGVLPRLRAAGFAAVVVRPAAGRSLLTTLASELAALLRPELRGAERLAQARELAPLLADGGLPETVRLALAEAGARRLLVVVDQGEELFAGTGQEADAAAAVLFPAEPPAELRVLVTLRADFLDAALAHPGTGPALRRTVYALTPMTREQLRAVIVRPVEATAAVAYDPGLVETMLDDAGGEPGALPLLGFVLDRLWREQERGQLRFDAYHALGGVRGALGRQAENIWGECVPAADEDVALRLLTGLVRVRPGGEAPLRNVLTRAEAGEDQWQVARALAQRRLLVLGSDPERRETVELAHEALIGAWRRLAERVRDDREFLLWRTELRGGMERWRAGGERTDRLPDADALRAARPWLTGRRAELSAAELDYLERGLRYRRTRRLRRRTGWTAGGLVLLLIATLGTFLAVESRAKAESDRQSRSRELAGLSAQLVEQDPGLAAMVAMAAYDTSPTREARNELLRRYDAMRGVQWQLSGAQGSIDALAMSADGEVALVTTELGRATLFVRGDGKPTRHRQLPVTENIVFPLVSADGTRLAYTDADGSLIWREVRRDTKELVGPAHTIEGREDQSDYKAVLSNPEDIADISQDGRRVVTVADNQRVTLWDLAAGERRRLPAAAPDGVIKVWFGPDDHTVVAAVGRRDKFHLLEENFRLVAVDTRTGTARQLADQVAGAALSGAGTVAMTCSDGTDGLEDATYRSIRVADGRKLGQYADDSLGCEDLAVDRTGARLAAGGSGQWRLFDVAHGKKLAETKARENRGQLGRRLLGGPEAPVGVMMTGSGITGQALDTRPREYLRMPTLLKDGSRMVARSGKGAQRRLKVVGTDERRKTLARSPRYTAQGIGRPLAEDDSAYQTAPRVNRGQTLVADLATYNKILVHALPSLHPVAEITVPMPRANNWDEREPPKYFFLGDDGLVTQVDGQVEYWDARTGRRLSRLDLRELKLPGPEARPFDPAESVPESDFRLNPYEVKADHSKADRVKADRSKADRVLVKVGSGPAFHVVDLRTGREDKKLGFRLGKDTATAFLDHSGAYAAVLTRGSLVELWSVRPGGTSKRIMGPIGPVGETGGGFTVDFLGDSPRFFLAEGNWARIYRAGGHGDIESYDFGGRQDFYDVTDDGKALLRRNDSADGVNLIRLDPAVWRNTLCRLTGQRNFTAAERGGVPAELPTGKVCKG
ncbi:trypsin-like peptidase domain-containing protein [Streptomyces sp. NPDC000151]|uniref:nSTAND1 domain-containing NTPase n=1 Tax=Streptomyces sp. NPDC000151 TaxID=3154244 RepID=UPI00332446F8